MERWQWQVVEAVYVAAQGEKAEAVARLHRMELLFRKTGHVAGEITATGCRGLIQASMNNPGARQLLMRSVYLAQEQKKQQQQAEEEVAAAVADKCALQLSRGVVGNEFEEAVGWYQLQRAPEMTVPRFRLLLVKNLLQLMRTHGRELGFRIHKAHQQVRDAAREAMMMSTSMRDNEPHLVRDILHIYERVAEAAVETQQLSRAVEMLREALELGSSSSSAGLLSIGDGLESQQWARTREEFIRYRMGRLLFKLQGPGNDSNSAAEALAMFANSLQCALQDDRLPDEECVSFLPPEATSFFAQPSHDEKCVLTRANAYYWAGHLIRQIRTGTCPSEQLKLAQFSVLTDVPAAPISRSLAMRRLVDAAVALIHFPQWQGEVMGHIETVLVHLVAPESSCACGSSNRSTGEADASNSLLFCCSAAAESFILRCDLLDNAAWLVKSLWPREQRREHVQAKLKAALEAVWEHCCRSLANNLDYLEKQPIVRALMWLVAVYQDEEEWAAAQGLLDALEPHLKDSRDFQRLKVVQLIHNRHYKEAAEVWKNLPSSAPEDIIDDAFLELALSVVLAYRRAGQHQSAVKMLNRLERTIRATTSWPPPSPDTDYVDPKKKLEFLLCHVWAMIAMETGRFDEGEIWLHKAVSVQEAIINDFQQQQLPVAKPCLWALVTTLTLEALIRFQLNKDDVKGLEARIERIQTLGPDAATVCELRMQLLLAKGDREEAMEAMRELFMRRAERQEGRGGDDDSWITDYNHGGDCPWINLAGLVDELEVSHTKLGQDDKALLWAERGRMRLFMHRVHAQQHQEDDPESTMDSTPNDFDRDDGKALDMLCNTLRACGPIYVALLEYSYYPQRQMCRVYTLFKSGSSSRVDIGSFAFPWPGIEQLVKKARDSIIDRPQQKGQAAAATARKQLRYLAKLHSLLVAPVLKELPDSYNTLIFVPDGCLSLVPFAALYDESAGQFLIQQKQVVVAPCLRALHRCLDLQDRFFSTASTQLQQPFVAGNPFPMGMGMPQLPHAQEEAEAVADILGVKPCLGAAVTKEAVLKGLGHSSVVVLASHAIVGPKFPAGALVLQGPSLTHDPDMASSSSRASTSAASNYDLALLRAMMMDPDSDEPEAALLMRGLQASVTDKSQVLTADELSGMRIPAGLVVLSACETGRGEVTPEGVLGLGRALLQAGAATTVLSLWKVEDKATKRLITEMFQELQKGEPLGTALRKAMLKMIQEGRSISQWAPFFIFGSPTMHLRNVTTLKG